jgi:oligopeptide transport system ATP-binding protein
MDPLLEVRNLSLSFKSSQGLHSVLKNISFHLYPGEIVALVGESGSGKTATAQTILQLHDSEHTHIEQGQIFYKKQPLIGSNGSQILKIRGKEIGMIFQDPLSALNPRLTIGEQMTEGLRHHFSFTRAEAFKKASELLTAVEISDPHKRMQQYPKELSGGMRQRVLIAIALACRPDLLIADEPTTALDVTVQAQILSLLKNLKKKWGLTILLITHDLSVVASLCDRVLVMYQGEILEEADVFQLFSKPQHSYTKKLLASVPSIHTPQNLLDLDEILNPLIEGSKPQDSYTTLNPLTVP